MFCSKCGKEIADANAQFCPNCGNTIAGRRPDGIGNTPASNLGNTQTANRGYIPVSNPMSSSVMAQPGQASAKKKRPAALIAVLCAVLVLALGGGGFLLFHMGGMMETAGTFTDDDGDDADDKENTEEDSDTTDTEEAEPDKEELAKRTMMVYMIGSTLEYDYDQNGEGYINGLASMDIDEMLAATYSEDLNIVLQTGGSTAWQNPQIKGGQVQRFEIGEDGLTELGNLGTVCMTEESTLSEFIKFAKAQYPAEEYVLVMWDHGGGVPNGFGQDSMFPEEVLSDVEIGSALETAGVHFDAIVFNACLMCSLEVYMSIQDYADYVVAAESVTWGSSFEMQGSGIEYTNFVNQLNDTERPVVECCEILLDDYMKFLKESNLNGTMSVIRMDRIQQVYNAYVKYISSCYQDLQNDGYAEIMKARDASGDFDGYDFVDLNTFLTKYENEYSTELQNAISNAIETTRSSGYFNGRGITAYFPYQLCHLYDDGRESFVELNYDTSIIGFYDLLASKQLYYNDQVAYAGNWYIEQTDTSQAGEPGEYTLEVTDMGDYQAVALTQEDWEIIVDSSIRKWAFYAYDERYAHYLGTNDRWTYDAANNLTLEAPQTWLQINGLLPTTDLYFRSEDEDGSIYREYFVYAYVNGDPAYILVTINGSSAPSIAGYFPCDFDTQEFDQGYTFNGDESVLLAIRAFDTESSTFIYRHYTDEFTASQLTASYGNLDLSDYDVYVWYEFEDVYGNSYKTEAYQAN